MDYHGNNRLLNRKCLYCGGDLLEGGPELFHATCIPTVEAIGSRIVNRKDAGKRKKVKMCFPGLAGSGPLRKPPKGAIHGLPK